LEGRICEVRAAFGIDLATVTRSKVEAEGKVAQLESQIFRIENERRTAESKVSDMQVEMLKVVKTQQNVQDFSDNMRSKATARIEQLNASEKKFKLEVAKLKAAHNASQGGLEAELKACRSELSRNERTIEDMRTKMKQMKEKEKAAMQARKSLLLTNTVEKLKKKAKPKKSASTKLKSETPESDKGVSKANLAGWFAGRAGQASPTADFKSSVATEVATLATESGPAEAVLPLNEELKKIRSVRAVGSQTDAVLPEPLKENVSSVIVKEPSPAEVSTTVVKMPLHDVGLQGGEGETNRNMSPLVAKVSLPVSSPLPQQAAPLGPWKEKPREKAVTSNDGNQGKRPTKKRAAGKKGSVVTPEELEWLQISSGRGVADMKKQQVCG